MPARVVQHVEGEHADLGAEPVGDLVDQLGPGDRGGVDADLVRAGRRRRSTSSTARTPPPTVRADEDLLGRAPDGVEQGAPRLHGRGDVEERDLVGAVRRVARGELDGVAGVLAGP